MKQQFDPEKKWFVVVTRQDRDWGEGVCNEEESYALVVMVTDRENAEAKLYTHIQAQLRGRQEVRARVDG